MAVDFAQLLSKPLDDVKKPPALPHGTMLGVIKKYEFGDNNTNKTPYCRFDIGLTGAGAGMDAAELEGIDLSKRSFRKDFYLTGDADWRLKNFIESLGIDTKGRTFAETVPETLNLPVSCEMIQQNSTKNPGELVNFLGEVTGAV